MVYLATFSGHFLEPLALLLVDFRWPLWGTLAVMIRTLCGLFKYFWGTLGGIFGGSLGVFFGDL